MGRKQKYPEHEETAAALMNALLDEVVAVWTGEQEPELKAIAEDNGLSPAKLRKLLITAGERDHRVYYSSATSDHVLSLHHSGATVQEIMEQTGLSYASVQGYLPHKTVYGLDTVSTEAERIMLYRKRRQAVEDLTAHLYLPDASLWLWRCVIAFQGYPFTTSGRGARPGTRYTYTISESTTGGGRRYEGEQVEGFGNEMWVVTLPDRVPNAKSISRSSVDLALKNALEVQEREGFVSGPKKLNTPVAHSYLYPLFVHFGVITSGPKSM